MSALVIHLNCTVGEVKVMFISFDSFKFCFAGSLAKDVFDYSHPRTSATGKLFLLKMF
jgi:hypothetical protein